MPPQEFNSFMKELLAGTSKGKRELAQLAGEIKQSILDHKREMEEYERKKSGYEKYKSKQDKTAKETEDDFMKQIQQLLNPPKRPGTN
jgi:DNA topoisomerase VI subunit B